MQVKFVPLRLLKHHQCIKNNHDYNAVLPNIIRTIPNDPQKTRISPLGDPDRFFRLFFRPSNRLLIDFTFHFYDLIFPICGERLQHRLMLLNIH